MRSPATPQEDRLGTAIIDVNLLLRYFTGDDPEKAARAERLFKEANAGTLSLRVTDVCLAELVWTLASFYRMPREDIADRLVALLNTPGFEFSNISTLLDASERYRTTNVDYVDAYHAAVAASSRMDVFSYNRDFDKFDDIKRLEP